MCSSMPTNHTIADRQPQHTDSSCSGAAPAGVAAAELSHCFQLNHCCPALSWRSGVGQQVVTQLEVHRSQRILQVEQAQHAIESVSLVLMDSMQGG